MVSFKYSGIFYNVLEMPLHEINTSVQLWDVIIGHIQTGQCTDRSTTVSICVRHNIEVSAHHDHCSRFKVQGFFICHIIVIQGIIRSEM